MALTNNYQQAYTGTKMIHKGKNTRSRIISKGISAGHSTNCYGGLVQVLSSADNAKNSFQCDSMLIGDTAAANTYPYIQSKTQLHASNMKRQCQRSVKTSYFISSRGESTTRKQWLQ